MVANEEQLAILRSGVEAWNAWRNEINDYSAPDLIGADLIGADLRGANLEWVLLAAADLSEADLSEADLSEANLSAADLHGANLRGATLTGADIRAADLSGADLSEAKLIEASLSRAYLCEADLRGAHLLRANLSAADLDGADLRGATLEEVVLVGTHLRGVDLRSCRIYGIAAWDLELDLTTKQTGLIITPPDQPTITVDNLEVAQFVYLLLNNQRIRHVIDTITSKVVLILGRFTEERKAVLDALRDELRRRDYLPVLFDFDKPASRDLTETIQTLAGMARFVIADLTDAKSLPQELMAIVPTLPSVPVQPLLLAGASEYAMFEHFRRYPWVLPIHQYRQTEDLLASLARDVIAPAQVKAAELRGQSRPPTS